MSLQQIPFNKLHPSPLNPRRKMDDAAVDALAASIEREGILQNLTARPHPQRKGEYEIIAGGTRYEAFGRLVEHSKREEDAPLPVRVKDPCSDLELLELAMVENLQRADLHPLDEAEGYAKLRALGVEVKDIAAKIGRTERLVQLRLQLADNLTEDTKQAYRAGKFPLASARILAATCPQARQAAVIERIEEGDYNYDTTGDLQRTLREQAIPLEHALFAREAYTGAVQVDDPELDVEDSGWELDKPVELAADLELFWKLQNQAVEARKAELLRGHAEVRIVRDKASWWQPNNDGLVGGCKDKSKAIAVVLVAKDGQVKEWTGLGKLADATGKKGTAKGKPTPKAGEKPAEDPAAVSGENTLPTKAGQVRAKHAKSRALRAALLQAGAPAAMIAACIGLMGEHGVVRLGYQDGYRGSDNGIAASEVEKVLAKYRVRLQRFLDRDSMSDVPGGPKRLAAEDEFSAAAIYRELTTWKAEEVEELFTALVAASVGTWPDNDPQLGDDPVAIAMAEHLQPDVAAVWQLASVLAGAYLDTLKRPGLIRTALDVGLGPKTTEGVYSEADLARIKAGDLRILVVHARHTAEGAERYLPPLFHFGTEEDLRRRILPTAKPEAAPAPAVAAKAVEKKAVKDPVQSERGKMGAAIRKAVAKKKVPAKVAAKKPVAKKKAATKSSRRAAVAKHALGQDEVATRGKIEPKGKAA